MIKSSARQMWTSCASLIECKYVLDSFYILAFELGQWLHFCLHNGFVCVIARTRRRRRRKNCHAKRYWLCTLTDHKDRGNSIAMRFSHIEFVEEFTVLNESQFQSTDHLPPSIGGCTLKSEVTFSQIIQIMIDRSSQLNTKRKRNNDTNKTQ